MSKVLRRREWNNGYGCQCCAQNWEETDWIEETDMIPIEKMFGIIDRARKKMSDDHQIAETYEKEGEVLYGYDARIYKVGEDSFIVWGNQKFEYRSSLDSHKVNLWGKAKILKAINGEKQ